MAPNEPNASASPEPGPSRPALRALIRRLVRSGWERLWARPEPERVLQHPVFLRSVIERRLHIEKLIGRSWSLSSLIPLAYLVWHGLFSAPDSSDYLESMDGKVVLPALAGVCSGLGAIVAIFLPLTLHPFTLTEVVSKQPEDQFRQQWLSRLQRVTKWNVYMTILVLLGNTVLVLVSVGQLNDLLQGSDPYLYRRIIYWALFLLVFGLTCFFLQLFTLGVAEPGELDRVGRWSLLRGVPWFSYIRSIFVILAVEVALSAAFGLMILWVVLSRFSASLGEVVFDFCIIVWLPLWLATLYTLLTSKRYRDMWGERFLKKWGESAGLGLVCNFELREEPRPLTGDEKEKRKILLNRQEQEPFRGMWLLPGGYINPKKNDRSLRDTVHRRLIALSGGKKLDIRVEDVVLASPVKESRDQVVRPFLHALAKRLKIEGMPAGRVARVRNDLAERLLSRSKRKVLDFSSDYSEAVLRYSHAPTDTCLYRVTGSEGRILQPQEIPTPNQSVLRWWSLKDIEDNPSIMPGHLRELLWLLVEGRPTELWSRGGPNAE